MQLPASMSKTGVVQLLYKTPESQAYFEMDTWGKPGALGWNQGMRWGTVLMFFDLGAAIDAIRKDISYPFLILHDPADELTDIAGSRQLIEESRTDPDHKQLIEVRFSFLFFPILLCLQRNNNLNCNSLWCFHMQVPGYLHGILVNETDKVCEYSINWMNQMLALPDVPEFNTISALHN